jgi:DNA polymerase elongation subunit (family B)
MGYPSEFEKYVLTKLETSENRASIARELISVFDIDKTEDTVRKKISNIARKHNIAQGKKPIKRLFFDIENSFIQGWFWDCGWKKTILPHQIIKDQRIITICYKWQYEDYVHELHWTRGQDDKTLLKKFIKVLGEADESIGHNIDRFDIPKIRTRCIQQDVLMFPTYRTLDTLKKAKQFFRFNRNTLDYIGETLGVGRKNHTTYKLWEDVVLKNRKGALNNMIEYCKQDVCLSEAVFTAMMPYIDHNTNFAVLKGADKWHCPECSGANVQLSHTDTTPMGYIKKHMKCNDCRKFFKISNRTYLRFLTENNSIREAK